ncbi:hypothetical protein M427DRAFT_136073 [Gonapodya prolifera JEL478]|uniref:Extracellular serine-rich protein n=1 Tax=Gonapodya prolifera (strain JEL478) TaxID=1344416 RepID=A0A139AB57_GONPJ|nr:hypothetical protein M427DRAFT_136073 [Gonapodya prolifera JEL478]|eukprot:KXS13980.1 hypothetical protein M427DRAFT_136073 [Gonapodya prolifera JEL478]
MLPRAPALLALVTLVLSGLANLILAQSTFTATNRILLLTTPGGGEDAPLTTFASYELQYDLLVVPTTGLAGDLPLLDANGRPKYSLVVLTSGQLQASVNGVWQSLLTTSQWAYLEAYEAKYGVRRVTLNDTPLPADGTIVANTAVFGTSAVQPISFNASYASLARVNPGASISNPGLYHYPATAYTPMPADIASVVPVAYFASAGTDYPTQTWAAVHVTYVNGREVMRFYTSFGFWSPCSLLLDHVWLAWGTRGLISGWRKTLYLAQVDDLFLTTEITPTQTTVTYNYRVSVADIQGIVAWQTSLNSRLPAGSAFKLELPFNGNGILERNGPDANWIDIDTESHVPVEFIKPAGAAADVRWPATFSTAWSSSALAAADPLYNYFITGGITAGNFFFTSHTFTHENFDNTSTSDIDKELKTNNKMAGAGFLNLVGTPWWSSTSMVTPQISGLHNEFALSTLLANGITTIVGDNSRPAISDSTRPYDFWVSTQATSNFDGYTVIPRWPCHVYFFCTQPNEIEYIYNNMYNATLGLSSWSQILQREQDRMLLLLLGIRHDPTMFHQANLRNADMPTVTVGGVTGKFGLLQQWVEEVFAAYTALVQWPVISLKGDDLAQVYRERAARNTCGASTSYDMNVSVAGVASVSTLRVTSTGSCKVPITLPGGTVVTSGQTVEQLGGDLPTVWVTVSPGQTQVITFTPPIVFSVAPVNATSTTSTTTTSGANTTTSTTQASTTATTSAATTTVPASTTPTLSTTRAATNTQAATTTRAATTTTAVVKTTTRTTTRTTTTTTRTTTTTAKKPFGSSCTSNSQCQSGLCFFFFCL